MEIEAAIAEFGAEAVLTYRRIARQQYDNDLPESFIGAFIAPPSSRTIQSSGTDRVLLSQDCDGAS